jgi:hypothetical protein
MNKIPDNSERPLTIDALINQGGEQLIQTTLALENFGAEPRKRQLDPY